MACFYNRREKHTIHSNIGGAVILKSDNGTDHVGQKRSSSARWDYNSNTISLR